jgi:ferric-dicitrate binding protein FerR (iron transport regulator)
MSQHPDDEALFASPTDSGVAQHVAGCDDCLVRSRRLAAGRALIDAVSRESVPPQLDWREIDAKVMAAAESTAADIRRGVLRPTRRIGTAMYASAALAAAAAALFAWRMSAHPTHVAPPVAHTHVAPAVPAPESHVAIAAAEPVEAMVLMVVAPVAYTAPGGHVAPVLLAANTRVRQGSHIAVDERGGRAVLALHSGYRLDARAGAEVGVSRLDTGSTVLALTKGEARVDGPRLDDERIAVEASGWTLHAKGGAFVAKIDADVVRLRVLSGKVGVSRGTGDEQDIVAGDEVELGHDGPSVRLVSHDARDPNELNMAFLTQTGGVFEVPALPGATANDRTGVSVVGFGSLPAGVSSLRANGPLALRAQVGSESYATVLDATVAPSGSVWRRAPRVAPTRSNAAPPSVAAVAPAVAPNAMPSATPQAAPAVAPVAANAGAETPQSTANAPRSREELEQELRTRAAPCFAQCFQANNCALHGSDFAYVTIDPDPDGHVTDVRVTGFASSDLTTCVEHAARTLRVPSYMVGWVSLHLQAPAHR